MLLKAFFFISLVYCTYSECYPNLEITLLFLSLEALELTEFFFLFSVFTSYIIYIDAFSQSIFDVKMSELVSLLFIMNVNGNLTLCFLLN